MCLNSGSENIQIHVRVLRCFTSWVTVHAISLESVPLSDVVAYAFQVSVDMNSLKLPKNEVVN